MNHGERRLKHYDASATAPLLPLDLWMPGTELVRGLPAPLATWLTEPGLLGERIRAATGAPSGIRVVGERLGFLSGEQQALLESPAASCFMRQVELLGRGRPWVFAETLIPDHTLEHQPWLAELGPSSLGATLAAVAGVTRGPFEFAPLPASHPLAASALERGASKAAVLWARRSWFALYGRRLLVQEVFLPEAIGC